MRRAYKIVVVYSACKTLSPLSVAVQGADKSLARPDWKKPKGRHFSSDAEVIAAAETKSLSPLSVVVQGCW